MAEILLSGKNPLRLVALVDDDDFELISAIRWYVHWPQNSKTAYAKTSKLMMHRVIMNAPNGYDVDHINRNGLDNRKANLQIVTHGENIRLGVERKWKSEAAALFDKYEHLL